MRLNPPACGCRGRCSILPVIAFPATDIAAKGPWERADHARPRERSSPAAVAVDAAGPRSPRRGSSAPAARARVRAIAEPAAGPITVEQDSGAQPVGPDVATSSSRRGRRLDAPAGVGRGTPPPSRVESRRVSGRTGDVLVARAASRPPGAPRCARRSSAAPAGPSSRWLLARREPRPRDRLPRVDGVFEGTLRYRPPRDAARSTSRRPRRVACSRRTREAPRRPLELMVAEQRPGSSRMVEIAACVAGLPRDPVVTVTRRRPLDRRVDRA